MADNKQGGNRRRRRPAKKQGDTSVTTGQQNQKKGQNQRGKGQQNQPKAKPKKQGGANNKNNKGGKQGQAQGKGKGKQSQAQPKQQAKKQTRGGKGSGKQAQKGGKQKQTKASKQQRNKKNQQNANRAKKGSKQARPKVSEERQRQKRKREDKQRINLIIRSKFQNPTKKTPTPKESQICEHLVNLEASNKDFKDELRALGIVKAKEIAVIAGKKAIVIFVPFFQRTNWQKIQDRVTRELEKKFSGQDVLFVAQRKVMKLNQIKNNYPRPRNQTITSVHEQILDDIVYPTRIVGKRTRFRVGGKRLLKVYLDPKDSKDIEPKLATYEAVYKKLTKKNVKFMFPRYTI